jgi:hypothetical protein
MKTKIFCSHTADSKPVKVKQEVNCTVILPPLVFPDETVRLEKSKQWNSTFLRLPLITGGTAQKVSPFKMPLKPV